ncbi:hypothetical protein [Aeromonas simiae]|uniref:hypothetical protein n=1 Tax=Aeromonas simiae TaxID=218936 RepID=UPI0005A8D769|nr:hypothetical protein [Aeromonas simiae]MDO2948709.1 hypothetical protein [Aeromonas simiae]MDO2952184.1 hypothetical protein [Aeromonas simiae]MDO2956092.1 hypothetical protein [Aeromonas simiae]
MADHNRPFLALPGITLSQCHGWVASDEQTGRSKPDEVVNLPALGERHNQPSPARLAVMLDKGQGELKGIDDTRLSLL